MNIKVLPLQNWMKRYPRGMEGYELQESEGFFKRDGYYLYGDKCWFEKDGKCFHYNKQRDGFIYELEYLNLPSHSMREYAALLEMRKLKLLSGKQLCTLNRVESAQYNNKSLRRSKSNALQRLKKYRKLREDNEMTQRVANGGK